MNTAPYTLTIKFHPSMLSDADVEILCTVACEVEGRCRRLSQTIAKFAVAEHERRAADEMFSEPIEPRMPKIAPSKWKDSEVARACQLLVIWHESLNAERVGAKAYLFALLMMLLALNNHRAERRGRG